MSEQWYCPNCGPTGEPYGHHGGVSADCPRCGEEQRKAPAFVTKMQEQIAILETSLAERWESLNVQDGIIDGLQEEIAALRAEKLTDASALRLALERIAELEKVVEALLSRSKVFGASGLTHEEAKALREAGYLKEEG